MTARAQTDVILSVEHVANRFGSQVVHEDVSFTVKRGEIIGVIGGSGSGKSVLMKTMVGLRRPDAGAVTIAGKPVTSLTPAETGAVIGVLFQEGALFSSLTVAENIMLPLREHTDLGRERLAKLAQLKLALVGMPADSAAKYPAQLSGGMVRRAALARALALDPQVLFLDEPTAGLDPVNAEAFDQLILDLNRSLGVTVVMITHDLDSLFSICDRVAVLIGKKVVIDTLPNLLKTQDPWLRQYLYGARGQGAAHGAKHQTRSEHGNG